VSTIAELFARNLARELERSPLTQEQVTTRAEIHRTQILKLLRGEQIPRVDTMIKLEGALGLKPATLIKDITWNPAARTRGEFTPSEQG
jgi:transcriptional regulator with XRE-family HTH domain